MRVSIVIPVYNVEAFLRACLDSILAQTHTDWEAILVDDGSSDGSRAICEQYCRIDPRFRLVSHNKNRGPSAARNTGISLSTSDILTFVDSDDLIHPLYLELMLVPFSKGVADITTCGITQQPFENTSSAERFTPLYFEAMDFYEEVLYQNNFNINNSVCAKLFSKSLFENNLFSEGILYEDLDITFKMMGKVSAICLIPESLYYYRTNHGSITHTFSTARANVLDVTEQIRQKMEREYPQLLAAANDRALSASFNILGLMAASGTNYNDIEKRCWRNIRELRFQSLKNPRVRLKNKLGILLSYAGLKVIRPILALTYRKTFSR